MEFFQRYKKIFMVGGFVLLVLILGYALYALFFRPSLAPAPPQPGVSTTTGGGLPVAGPGKGQIVPSEEAEGLPAEGGGSGANQIAQGGLTQTAALASLPTIGATLSGDGTDVQYYSRDDGKFYRIDPSGQVEALSDQVFHQVKDVTWAPDKKSAILEYPDGANIIYDFPTKKQITLPAHWQDFSYSPSGDRIVMKSIANDPDASWLAIVGSDGSNVRGIEQIGKNADSVYPAWSPSNQMVAMYTEGVDFDRQEVYFVGLNQENFKSTIVEGRGFDPKWSPAGDRLLYSVYSSKNDLKPNLWLVNASGDNIGTDRRNLNLETWADKCTFTDNASLYCAVPKTLDQGAGLFPEMAQNTADQLYKIDLNTGAKRLIAIPDGDYTIAGLMASGDGRNLFFTDKNSGKLYKIRLK